MTVKRTTRPPGRISGNVGCSWSARSSGTITGRPPSCGHAKHPLLIGVDDRVRSPRADRGVARIGDEHRGAAAHEHLAERGRCAGVANPAPVRREERRVGALAWQIQKRHVELIARPHGEPARRRVDDAGAVRRDGELPELDPAHGAHRGVARKRQLEANRFAGGRRRRRPPRHPRPCGRQRRREQGGGELPGPQRPRRRRCRCTRIRRRALEIVKRIADVTQPPARVLHEAAFEQPPQRGWRGRRQLRPVGSCSSTAATTSDAVGPWKARRPLSNSKSTQPHAQMSVRRSTR